MKCPHENFESTVDVYRQTDGDGGPVTSYSANVTIRCTQCDERFEFLGLEIGSSPSHPTISFDGTELRLPLMPKGMMKLIDGSFTYPWSPIKTGLA